jgi:hypothetical protein
MPAGIATKSALIVSSALLSFLAQPNAQVSTIYRIHVMIDQSVQGAVRERRVPSQ